MLVVQVELAIGGAGAAERAVAIEGRQGDDVDLTGNGVGVEIGRQALDHRDRADQRRGNVVQLDLAVVGFGRGGRLAVDRDVGVARIHAADDHVAAFALVVGDADARQAVHGLGHVLVGQLAHVVGVQGLDEVVGDLLGLQGAALGGALARDDDLGDGVRRRQGDLDLGGRAVRQGHRRRRRAVADIVHPHLGGARRQAAQREAAVGTGDGAAVADENRRAGQRQAAGVDDATAQVGGQGRTGQSHGDERRSAHATQQRRLADGVHERPPNSTPRPCAVWFGIGR